MSIELEALAKYWLGKVVLFDFAMKIPRILLIACLSISPILFFLILDLVFPIDFARLKRPIGQEFKDRNGKIIRETLAHDSRIRFPVDIDNLELFKKVVLCHEDQYFEFHPGVNPISLIQAIFHNVQNERKVGGSTISMQVARMIEGRERKISSKFIEIFRALQIEWSFSKDEILRFYLQLAPYGGNLEGARSASRLYFSKSLEELDLHESIYLAILPKNPNAYCPNKESKIPYRAHSVIQRLKAKFCAQNEHSQCEVPIESFLSTSIRRRALLDHAPHWTRNELILDKKSLDLKLQMKLKKLLAKILENPNHLHQDGAGVLLDWKNNQVLAYLGSANFYSKSQIDAVRVKRSPGSLLKPFLYARALEMGLIRPKSLLLDTVYDFASYRPQNLDKRERGLVTAQDALNLSLNPVAVLLEWKLNKDGLRKVLEPFGSFENSGSSIALGGVELSLWQLLKLYSSLLNDGKFDDLKRKAKSDWIGLEASRLTLSMLLDNIERSRAWKNREGIIYKTGTSSNYRDHWMVMADGKYLLGIWIGSLNFKEGIEISSLNLLHPPTSDFFRSLEGSPLRVNLENLPGLESVNSCQDSILFDATDCKNLVPDYKIKKAVEDSCALIHRETLEYSTNLRQKLSSHCDQQIQRIPPKIAWPTEGAILLQSKASKKVLVSCVSHQLDDELSYYLNQVFVGTSVSGQAIHIEPDLGIHELMCTDKSAMAHTIKFEVRGIRI